MKQNIIIGNKVDDGTGDYLRKGGTKINSNFNELYDELGDGERPHAAGAWKRYSTSGTPLTVAFGDAYTLNTTGGMITVNLPSGSSADYGKVIRLRDVNGTWSRSRVKLVPNGSDTIKGYGGVAYLQRDWLDAELVYCAPGRWEYAENKLVSGITNTDSSTVVKKEIIATEGQTVFTDLFDTSYNVGATEVYRRGNLLYYGDKISDDSDFGSALSKTPTPATIMLTVGASAGTKGYEAGLFGSITSNKNRVEGLTITKFVAHTDTSQVQIRFSNGLKPLSANVLVVVIDSQNHYLQYDNVSQSYIGTSSVILGMMNAGGEQSFTVKVYELNTLDGKTIKLRDPCFAGDVITIVSYMDGIASYRTSYTRKSLVMYDEKLMPPSTPSVAGQIWVGDLSKKSYFTLDEFDMLERETYNPYSFELLINGRQLTQAGEAGLPAWGCVGAEGDNEYECVVAGGAWVPTGGDFSLQQNADGRWRNFSIDQELEHGDIVTIRWYNNDLGTLSEWEGVNGIRAKADARYLDISEKVDRKNKTKYSDISKPSTTTAMVDQNFELGITLNTVQQLMETIYPVGSLYFNAHNTSNPHDYMGFGTWVRYAEGKVPVGWNASNPNDPNFGLNYSDLDVNGNPRHSPGGSGGSVSSTLTAQNIPPSSTHDKVLVVDDAGDILVGGCQYDPDEDGPGFNKYREDNARTRPGETANPINIIQPFVTVNIWLRVN